jgi:hypothetical protein
LFAQEINTSSPFFEGTEKGQEIYHDVAKRRREFKTSQCDTRRDQANKK